MATHTLKTDPEVFEAIWMGKKFFELRFNDRNFKAKDLLILKETKYSGQQMANGSLLEYTGRTISVRAIYIIHGPVLGLSEGWVIMSIKEIDRDFE